MRCDGRVGPRENVALELRVLLRCLRSALLGGEELLHHLGVDLLLLGLLLAQDVVGNDHRLNGLGQ